MKKYIVFDTETTNSLDDPMFFDIGWAVIDETGKITGYTTTIGGADTVFPFSNIYNIAETQSVV